MPKEKKAKVSQKAESPEAIPDDVITLPELIANIIIKINCCEHLKPIYSATDVVIKAQYLKLDPWESPRIPVTDDDYLEIDKVYTLSTNLNSKLDMDNLISYPVKFTVIEHPGIMDPELYAQLNVQNVPEVVEEPIITCVESAANLSDMLQDEKIDRTTLLRDVKKKGKGKKDDKKEKGKKGSKDKRGSKTSKKSSKSASSKDTVSLKPPSGPQEVGYGSLDLLPLFLGKEEFSEKIILRQPDGMNDDSMIPKDCLPTLTVTVIVDSPWYTEEKKTNVVNLTLEAAYNLPSIIMTNMEYKICTHIMREEKLEPFVSIGGKVSNILDRERIKYWPPITTEDIYLEPTKYRIDRECRTVRNSMDNDLDDYLNKDVPKIEWNILKRFFLKTDGTNLFNEYVKRFRKIGLEFLITPKVDQSVAEKPVKKGAKDKGKEKGKSSQTVDAQDSFSEFFHFMTFIDVSSLLYPGVNKVRVVCPLRSYQSVEFESATNVRDSFFIPKPPEVPPTPVVYKGGKSKGGSRSSKGSSKKGGSKKGGSKKGGSKKGGAGDGPSEKTNLNKLLPPPPPPPPEPSFPIYDDLGRQTFIIVEIELLKPIFLPRNVEDLSNRLQEIVPQRPSQPKCVIDSVVSEQIFKEAVKEMIENLSCDYQNFLIEKQNCECTFEDSEQNSFLNYLSKVGSYQVYFKSIIKSTSLIIKNKFPFRGDTNFGNKYYLNHISTVYSYLVTEMNEVINNVVTYDVNKEYKPAKKNLNRLLYYAKEATELNAFLLARNYYLKRICSDERNPKCWYDFAVFNLQMDDEKQSFECVQEALGVDSDHSYSLILYGFLLSKRGLPEQAETCFLSAITGNLRWLEGWGAIHIFYVSISNQEGSDFCLEMAKKCIENDRTDYALDCDEDFSWTMQICPNTIFFRTACLFIKMRAYEFAEIALSYEINKNPGLCHYYLAVITYLQKNYEHALSHLQETRKFYGLDYAVLGLEGHCNFQQKQFENANENYQRVLQLFNRPEDIHLIYINMSLAYKALGDDTSALKIILLPCKLSPSAYTWFMAGLNYFHKYDFLSAEECFTQANIYDNSLAEIWAYLTLVNLHLGRLIEADLCYAQTIKNELMDEILLEDVRKAMKTVQ